jgi:integrase
MPRANARRSPSSKRWNAEVEEFLRWKQREAPVSEAWIARMRWELRRFPHLLRRANFRGFYPCARRVGPEEIQALRAALPWEKATFALHFAALRQFLAWARNPSAVRRSVWRLPSGEPTHRRWLTKGQFLQLLRGSTGRGRLLVELEGLNGLRRVEVLRLRVRDVALDEGCLRVLGKGKDGGKWRKIPIHPAVEPDLRRFCRGRGPDDRLFAISRSGADLLLRQCAIRSGLRKTGVPVSHHDLRRTFGRLAHAAGMDLIQLKNLYGHAALDQTVHYIGLDADGMRQGLVKLGRSLGRRPRRVLA